MRGATSWFVIAIAVLLLTRALAAAPAPTPEDTCEGVLTWSDEFFRHCMEVLSKRVESAPKGSFERTSALVARAELRDALGSLKPSKRLEERAAALEDYSAAVASAPNDERIRYGRARFLLRIGHSEGALKDADVLIAKAPDRAKFVALKGDTLFQLNRMNESIEIYSRAIGLTQFCAEASLVQQQVNALRATPGTDNAGGHPFIAATRPVMNATGLRCAPPAGSSVVELALLKINLLNARGQSRRATGDDAGALKDYEEALSISPELFVSMGHLQICQWAIETRQSSVGVEHCRRAFEGESISIIDDPGLAAKIGNLLLADGDLKGACRNAFPFMSNDELRVFSAAPEVQALQRRVRSALAGAGLKGCAFVDRHPDPASNH
jgi:tetratricopeptide (TPR) repeat protein